MKSVKEKQVAKSTSEPEKHSTSNRIKPSMTYEEFDRINEEGKNEWFRLMHAQDVAEYEFRISEKRP